MIFPLVCLSLAAIAIIAALVQARILYLASRPGIRQPKARRRTTRQEQPWIPDRRLSSCAPPPDESSKPKTDYEVRFPDEEGEEAEERRAKAMNVAKRFPCAACGGRFDPEAMASYGQDGEGKPLYLCPACQKLIQGKK